LGHPWGREEGKSLFSPKKRVSKSQIAVPGGEEEKRHNLVDRAMGTLILTKERGMEKLGENRKKGES